MPTENAWSRLHRIVKARAKHLGLTMTAVQAVGGPSPAWIHKLPHETGQPSTRHTKSLRDLDRAMRWREGTSWGLLADDRSSWTDEVLRDEEVSLISAADRISNAAWLWEQRLRSMPEELADEIIRETFRLAGLPVIDR